LFGKFCSFFKYSRDLSKITVTTYDFTADSDTPIKPSKTAFLVLLNTLKYPEFLAKQKQATYYTPLYFGILLQKLQGFPKSDTIPILRRTFLILNNRDPILFLVFLLVVGFQKSIEL
jgi:hypothetical protein